MAYESAIEIDMTDPLGDHLGFLVHDVARALTAAYAARMASLGITRAQARAIAYVWRSSGISQVELAENMGIGRMAMTGLLDRMESKGLVTRKGDPNDLRVNRIYLTKSALALRPEMEEIARELHAGSLAGVSSRDLRTTVTTLRRMLHNAEQMTQSAGDQESDD